MKGFSLAELLFSLSFVAPLGAGFWEGNRTGVIGGAIGLLVGLVISVLWGAVVIAWMRCSWEKMLIGQPRSWAFRFVLLIFLFALPVMAGIITHQLTTRFHY